MKKRIVIEFVLFVCFIVLLCFGCKKNGPDVSVPVPVLTTDTITVITQTTATVNSKVESEGDAQLKSMGVCWSTTQTPTINDFKCTCSIG